MGSVYNILKRVKGGRGKRQQVWSAPYQPGQPMIQHPPLEGEVASQSSQSPPPVFQAPPASPAPPAFSPQPPPVQFILPPITNPTHKRPALTTPVTRPVATTAPLTADALSVPTLPQSTITPPAPAPPAPAPPVPCVPLATMAVPMAVEPAAVIESPSRPQLPVVPKPPAPGVIAESGSQPMVEMPVIAPPPPPPPPATLTNTTIKIDLKELPAIPGEMPAIDPAGEPIVIPSPHMGVGHYIPQVVVHHDRGSIVTEQYRAIRLQILARCRNRKLQTHVITSSAPDEGKTLTAINLAMAFAELQNKRTLLIEGDLRRPSFQNVIGQQLSPGLLQLLREDTNDIGQAIHDTPYDNVKFMPAGDHGTTASTELLSTHRFPQILDQLKQKFDHILIDTPPVISVTDACIFGALADEVILVVRLNETPVEVVDRTKRLLRASNCEVAGVVLTHMKYHIPKTLYRYL